jgi:AP endonuclease-1
MPKVTKRQASRNDAPKRKSKSNETLDEEEDQPVITVVDKTESKKGIKRKASASVQNAKKVSTVNNAESIDPTQELDNEEIQLPRTMTLKTSDRLSPKGNKATLKLVSWNINGIRGWLTNGGLKYIEQEQPDIICFQVQIDFYL